MARAFKLVGMLLYASMPAIYAELEEFQADCLSAQLYGAFILIRLEGCGGTRRTC